MILYIKEQNVKFWYKLIKAVTAIFVQLLQFHLFVQCSRFISVFVFVSRHICFQVKSDTGNHVVVEWIDHMVFTTEGFLEVAIGSWPEWNLNPRPLNSVQMLKSIELSGHEFNSLSEPTLYNYSNFISLLSVHVSFRSLHSSVATFAFKRSLAKVITL